MNKYNLTLGILLVVNSISYSQEIDLDSCINFAFQNSPYLKAKRQNIKISNQNFIINKHKYLPTVKASANYTITDQYNDFDKYTSLFAGIEVAQSIWQNGKLRALIKQSEISYQMEETQFAIEKLDLEFTIKSQYINLLKQQHLEKLSKEIQERISVNVESAKELYKVGITRQSDILKAETELSNAILVVLRNITEQKIAERNLIKIMGANLNQGLWIVNTLKNIEYAYTNQNLDFFYQKANRNLPELILAAQSIINQDYAIKYEKKANRLDLGLNAGYSWLDTPQQENTGYGYGGLFLNFTIFDRNERKSRIAKETIRREQLEYEKQELQQIIKLEIQEAYLILLEAKQQIVNSLQQLENSTKNLKIVRGEYKEGISSMLELLDAENADFEANQNYINSLALYHLAMAAIERKSGITKF